MAVDLVLSSGFLAFAEHAGFLRAVEEAGLEVTGVCGTSSGALAGALWAAGMPAREVLDELVRVPPLRRVALHRAPWRGALSLDPVRPLLADRLPARLEDFPLPMGVGVADPTGAHALLTAGPAPDAVLASCAVPWLFAPVPVRGRPYRDGGVADRTALAAWRGWRAPAAVALHLVARSAGAPTRDDLTGVTVVRSPRSRARLWDLGDARARYEGTRRAALDAFT